MGLIKTGITLAGGYAMIKAAAGAVEKHDANKQQYQQSPQPPQQYIQPGSRPTYGKYIAPDGREYPVYEPQPHLQGTYQQVQSEYRNQNQTSRSIGYEPYQNAVGKRSISPESRSFQQSQDSGFQPPASSTPPPYQHNYKN